jgi:hypothetical protein
LNERISLALLEKKKLLLLFSGETPPLHPTKLRSLGVDLEQTM